MSLIERTWQNPYKHHTKFTNLTLSSLSLSILNDSFLAVPHNPHQIPSTALPQHLHASSFKSFKASAFLVAWHVNLSNLSNHPSSVAFHGGFQIFFPIQGIPKQIKGIYQDPGASSEELSDLHTTTITWLIPKFQSQGEMGKWGLRWRVVFSWFPGVFSWPTVVSDMMCFSTMLSTMYCTIRSIFPDLYIYHILYIHYI